MIGTAGDELNFEVQETFTPSKVRIKYISYSTIVMYLSYGKQ